MLNTVSKCSSVKTCLFFKITLTEQLNLWLYIKSSLFWESVTWGNTLREVNLFNWPVVDGQNAANELPTISPSSSLLHWGALLNLAWSWTLPPLFCKTSWGHIHHVQQKGGRIAVAHSSDEKLMLTEVHGVGWCSVLSPCRKRWEEQKKVPLMNWEVLSVFWFSHRTKH